MDLTLTIKNFLKNIEKNKIPLVIILGPTASGKTNLAIDLALKCNGEIISADSRQVYKEMNIGTAKIKTQEMKGIPHYLIDVVNPDESFTTYDFKIKAEDKIKDIYSRGKIPFIVGGTGLYIKAITDNFDLGQTPPDLKLRQELEDEASKFGKEYVWEKLKKLDSLAAEKIHFNNLRYVIRAIEKAVSGKRLAISQTSLTAHRSPLTAMYSILKIGIDWPREILYDRINKRVDKQIEDGLIEETKMLLSKYDLSLPSMSGLGYPQIAKFVNGEISLEEAKNLLKQETRHYAKRQMTWFRKEEDINWIDGNSLSH